MRADGRKTTVPWTFGRDYKASSSIDALEVPVVSERSQAYQQFCRLLDQPSLDPSERWKVYDSMVAALRDHPELYWAEWLPRLQSFPRHLREPFDTFFDYEGLEAACRRSPGCPFALVVHRAPDIPRVLDLAARCRLVRLDLGGHFFSDDRTATVGDAGVVALASSPQLQWLQRLDLGFNHVGSAGVAALARSPHLRRLTHLTLSGNRLGSAAVAHLAESPLVESLVQLELAHNSLDDDACRALAAAPGLPGLRALDLAMNFHVGDAGAAALAEADGLSDLERLSLNNSQVGDVGVAALADSVHLGSLTELRLWSTRLTDDGALALAHSAHLSRLALLVVGNTEVTVQGVLDLLHAPHLASLERLEATHLPARPSGGDRPPTPRTVPAGPASLRVLDLEYARLGDDGVQALAWSDRIIHLRELDLSENGVSDHGAIALARSPFLQNLRGLSLGNGDEHCVNTIGLPGVRALASASVLHRLDWLELDAERIGPEGIEALVDSTVLPQGVKEQWLQRL